MTILPLDGRATLGRSQNVIKFEVLAWEMLLCYNIQIFLFLNHAYQCQFL